MARYGWLRFIYELSDLDLQKVDDLVKRGAYEVFTFACYRSDKNEMERARIEKIMQRTRRG